MEAAGLGHCLTGRRRRRRGRGVESRVYRGSMARRARLTLSFGETSNRVWFVRRFSWGGPS